MSTDWHNPWALTGGTGTGRAPTGGTDWQHSWVALVDTGGWHWWAELVGALLGTGGRNLRVALLGTDHQGTDHQCPDDRCRIPALTTAGSRQYFPHDLTA
ncbi:unnamed protein product [Staurois parvus]|uniref:Uncharacterized protein n=1 Tax=Staurois parvus TaxID=386267 RepID=A0ABN9EX63_9NEOB|nr:unnamed protein product [Staurois parvus]